MNFIPLSSLKSKQVKMPSSAKESIESYAEYISSQKGADYDSSDIVTKVLLDDGFEKEVRKVRQEKIDKVSLKLPEAAWKNFEDLATKGGLTQEELVELISKKLLKDRKFLGWKKKTANDDSVTEKSSAKNPSSKDPSAKKTTAQKS